MCILYLLVLTEPQRHVCVALKQVERLLVGLREQGADCFPLEFCRKPPSWQSASFFDLLDVLLRACLRAPSTPNHLIRLTAFSSCGTTPVPGRVRGVLRSLTENLLTSFGQDLEVASKAAGVSRPAGRLLEAFLRRHGDPAYLCSMFDLEDFDSRLTVLVAFLDGFSWLLNAGLLPGNAVQCILQGTGSQILDTLNAICETAPTSPALNNLVQASSCSIFWNTVVSFLAASFRQSATDAASLFASNSPVWRCLALMIMKPQKLYLNRLEWLTDACGTSQLRQLLYSLPLDIVEHIVKLSRDALETAGLTRPDYDLSWLDFTSFEEEKKALKRATKLAHMLTGVTFLIGVVDASVKTVLTSALPDGLCQSLGNKIYLDEFSEETVRWIFRVAPFIAGGADSRQPLPPHLLLFIGLSADPDTSPGPSLFSKSPRSALELVTELIERLGTSTSKQDTPRPSSFLSKLCEKLSKVWPLKIQPLVADSSCDSSIKNAAVELLERVILFAPQVKILDMLAFFLHVLPPSTGLSLPSDERSRLCEAVKLFLAANLPLDLDEFSQLAVLSCLEMTACPEVMSALAMTFCRHASHPLDEDLTTALRKALQKYARPFVEPIYFCAFANNTESFHRRCGGEASMTNLTLFTAAASGAVVYLHAPEIRS
ncbi:unnamed protein product [Dibothriocephalus latus]|uniref:Uncharacterized protein n=1 Tax=Dibothriocephalus latus TaxID=60516 RepID=A0A3P7KX21_DIBLA|nr:unnamed protein product [Dibothriocephalus latus]